MSQEQLKDQFLEYAKNNLDNITILESVKDLIDNISNELYQDGFIYESNSLTTCYLIIKEVIEKC